MIIDAHGHFTTAPPAIGDFRRSQLDWIRGDPGKQAPVPPEISDEAIRDAVEDNQLRVLRERGSDLMLLSPRASAMQHHVENLEVAVVWARLNNNIVHRVTQLYPREFAGVCQLPQTPATDMTESIRELRRCVEELGFVGCNLNPDPSGGAWSSPPLTDEYWYPLYEAMVELDVPAMVHVSASCLPAVETLGAYYLGADTAVFTQLLSADLFNRFPTLRLVIPHGGGAVPYHWGRYCGLAERYGWSAPDTLLDNVFFDTTVYHQAGIDLLFRVVGAKNLLFASEMLGAVRGVNPQSGREWDDTKIYVEAAGLDVDAKRKVFQSNALRVYPRLVQRLGDLEQE